MRQIQPFKICLRKAALRDNHTLHSDIILVVLKVAEEMEVVAGLIEKSIATNAITALDQDEYRRRYNDLTDRFRAEEEKYKQLSDGATEWKLSSYPSAVCSLN